MKYILGVLMLVLVFGYLAVGLDRGTPKPNPTLDANAEAIDKFRNHATSLSTVSPSEVDPGSPSVYRSIDAMTDCRELQATFEKNVFDSAGRESGTFLQKVTLSYATHASERMKQLGC